MARSHRLRRLRKSDRTWDAPALPWIFGLIAGLFPALVVHELWPEAHGMAALARGSSLAMLWAFLAGFVGVALPVLAIQKQSVRVTRELRACVNVRPLTGEHAVGTDRWSMDAVFAENLVQLLHEEPDQIVEMGSGHSSILIARRLAHSGRGHLTSVDHLQEFADRTRGWLEDQGLSDVATVVHAPLADQRIDGRDRSWYSLDALEGSLPSRIDLLVVDGPPGKIGREARWPAVPLLRDRLAPDVVVLLDDGDRADEARLARAWHETLGGELRYLPGGRGGWLLRGAG